MERYEYTDSCPKFRRELQSISGGQSFLFIYILQNTKNITQIVNWQELQQIASNLSPDIDFKEFAKTDGKCTVGSYSFLVIDTKIS